MHESETIKQTLENIYKVDIDLYDTLDSLINNVWYTLKANGTEKLQSRKKDIAYIMNYLQKQIDVFGI